MTPPPLAPRDVIDLERAQNYDVLALLLAAPPTGETLAGLSQVTGDDTPLGQAWSALASTAAQTSPEAISREFFDLFIGVGRGELLPYASFYVTGFLNERPLAELRGDLAALGIARHADDHDPEDRIAMLLAVMAAFARGDFDAAGAGVGAAPDIGPDTATELDAPATPPATPPGETLGEARFYARHLAPWVALFFDDLAQAPAADFYAQVAQVGRLFVDIETRAFALQAQNAAAA